MPLIWVGLRSAKRKNLSEFPHRKPDLHANITETINFNWKNKKKTHIAPKRMGKKIKIKKSNMLILHLDYPLKDVRAKIFYSIDFFLIFTAVR